MCFFIQACQKSLQSTLALQRLLKRIKMHTFIYLVSPAQKIFVTQRIPSLSICPTVTNKHVVCTEMCKMRARLKFKQILFFCCLSFRTLLTCTLIDTKRKSYITSYKIVKFVRNYFLIITMKLHVLSNIHVYQIKKKNVCTTIMLQITEANPDYRLSHLTIKYTQSSGIYHTIFVNFFFLNAEINTVIVQQHFPRVHVLSKYWYCISRKVIRVHVYVFV